KTLGALGDGGAVWTGSPALAKRLRALRQHGQLSKQYPSSELGRNSRLDAFQAAMLSVFLPHLDDEIKERRALLERYRARLSGCPGLTLLGPDHLDGHGAQQMIVRSEDRDGLASYLQDVGVGTAIYYRAPLHHLKPYRQCPALGELTNAEQAARQTLALPLYPGLSQDAVDEVCSRIISYQSSIFDSPR
ncbi:MAG: DegT/DnrJ/EryC1/StrS family aminotransferase, partial [Myxococcales bacterium]|nr:DegT/DnrJ/EryC1/StrS family aminotransferase [Polyangiaceae bacterium]MDW8252192.1 DegT/DnrJ/EryC1/StrS family aminotransferase [Myxococcales bacterium]